MDPSIPSTIAAHRLRHLLQTPQRVSVSNFNTSLLCAAVEVCPKKETYQGYEDSVIVGPKLDFLDSSSLNSQRDPDHGNDWHRDAQSKNCGLCVCHSGKLLVEENQALKVMNSCLFYL